VQGWVAPPATAGDALSHRSSWPLWRGLLPACLPGTADAYAPSRRLHLPRSYAIKKKDEIERVAKANR
jgi:hypothetical protein